MPTYREAALKVAVSQLGVTEDPAGSNSGPRVNEYLRSTGLGPGYPWCMAFVHWCFKKAGVDLGGGASVGNFEAWGKQHGALVVNPQPGDIVCYRFDADNWPDHVGIVETVSTDKSIHTIEGNTAYGNDANGGKVMRRIRRINRCSFVRIPGSVPEPRVTVVKDGRVWLKRQKLSNPTVWRRVKAAARSATLTIRRAK